jgi:hypothetical protein
VVATGKGGSVEMPPEERGAPACPTSQPQGAAAAVEEGEGEEEPTGEMRAPAWAGGETPGDERRASA